MANKTLTPAQKAARTRAARRAFIERFGVSTFEALTAICHGRTASFTSTASMAAYRANLTRGAYSEFVTVNKNGKVTRDRLALSNLE